MESDTESMLIESESDFSDNDIADENAPKRGNTKMVTAKKATAKKTAPVKKPAVKKKIVKATAKASVKEVFEEHDDDSNDDDDFMEDVQTFNTAPTTGKKKTVEEMYQKKTQLEHILLRPDTYSTCTVKLGSLIAHEA
jgi:DNA topoisomerase II